ncbi:hypothetical protein D9758_006310 [Tetrapyrgos nigripes]|uniref:Uncharacterized protein n=1 Tax=Tetrapyrgos nigripes TaxID=182062 RepID=A0A8H5G070_9AGAR|nr:hypothetical protein D9758_006310 [Tetrapyrgos nigripes]
MFSSTLLKRTAVRLVCLAIPIILILVASHSVLQSSKSFQLYGTDHKTRTTSPYAHSRPGSKGSEGILLVSCLFPLSKAKHSADDYAYWMSNFLGKVKTDIYFYTTPGMASTIARLRGDLPIIINTTFSSPYDIPPLLGLEDHYEEMHRKDRERKIHSPELYAVWNGKAYYLDEALKNSVNEYEYVFWTDAGSFRREHFYEDWPDYDRVEELWEEGSKMSGMRKEDLFFIPTAEAPGTSHRYWEENMGPVDTDFTEGSFFGGRVEAIEWFRKVFYAYHDHYLSLGMFVGKDQTVFNSIMLLYPSRIITVWLTDPHAPAHKGLYRSVDAGMLGDCGNPWFYYQFFLAEVSTRGKMREFWKAEREYTWDWWEQRQTCRLTRLLTMKDLLGRRYGYRYIPPGPTLRL